MKLKTLCATIFLAGTFAGQGKALAQCHASFTYTVSGATVTLTDASTYTSTINYRWDFGDGQMGWTQSPSHTYQYAGKYIVCLTISDSLPNTCNSSHCDTVDIVNAPHPPCDASFTYYKDSAGSYIYFDNKASYIAQWSWDFGDGTSSNVQSPAHQYGSIGTYSVCLTTITTFGDTCTFCDTVNSTPCAQLLNASFTHYYGTSVTFTSTSTGAVHPTYYWDFGDGNSSNQQNPVHYYQFNGTYTACLTYGDSSGCATGFCDTIMVGSSANPPCNAGFKVNLDSLNPNNNVYFSNTNSTYNVKWIWNFGDGTSDNTSGPNVNHQYPSQGKYLACLTTITSLNDTCVFCDSVNTVPCWQRLNTSFTFSGNNPVSFTSSCSGAAAPMYDWSFGDGGYSTLPNPIHTYSYNGSYVVYLTYRDSLGCSEMVNDTVTITNAANYPCNALFSFSPDTFGNAINFFDQSTTNVTGWSWSFPGGSPSTSSAPNVRVSYASPGTYSVCLTVTNQSGLTCSYCNTVTVTNNVCTTTNAYFTMQPDSTPHVWVVNNQSTGAQPMTYTWTWGDGTNATGMTPSHTYSVAGQYNICLTISDANGCGSSYCSYDSLYRNSSTIISVYVVSSVTGVQEPDFSSAGVSVYPNPSAGKFIIKNEKGEIKNIEVYNMFGEKVLSEGWNTKQGILDMGEAASGVYWLKLYGDGEKESVSKKLILIK